MFIQNFVVKNIVDFSDLIQQMRWDNFPVGLSGCRTGDYSYDTCDYDITVFDNQLCGDEIIKFQNKFLRIHHGFLSETKSKILIQYDDMKILQDESWDLRMLLSKIKEKKQTLYRDFAKNSLLDSIFCCEKSKQGIKESNVFAPCWQKCAAYFLADGIMALNKYKPSPTHMLDEVRKLEKNSINEKISIVNETTGIERSTPSLLERILKSTMGLSDILEKNHHSSIIQQQHNYFINHSMLSDCYFYLGYVNKEIFSTFRDSILRQPDLMHILKVSFDIDVDKNLLEKQVNLIEKASNDILESISKR